MKPSYIFASMVLLGLVGLWGCERTHCGWDGPETRQVATVQIHMDADTLNFLPGDTARCDGWVVVRDRDSLALSGIPVTLTLAQNFGSIALTDTTNGNVTDSTGRVHFRFVCYCYVRNDTNVVIASVRDVYDEWPLYVRQATGGPDPMSLNVNKYQICTDTTFSDSVQVTVTLDDENWVGRQGVEVQFFATGGRLFGFPATTDSNGVIFGYWAPTAFGTFTITALANGRRKAVDVRVDSCGTWLRGHLSIHVPSDTIRYHPGDTIRVDGYAEEKDFRGVGIRGDTIDFLTPALGQVNPPENITNTQGDAHFRYTLLPSDAQLPDPKLVIARSRTRGLTDTVRFVLVPEGSRP
jgi:hypothetical protein